MLSIKMNWEKILGAVLVFATALWDAFGVVIISEPILDGCSLAVIIMTTAVVGIVCIGMTIVIISTVCCIFSEEDE